MTVTTTTTINCLRRAGLRCTSTTSSIQGGIRAVSTLSNNPHIVSPEHPLPLSTSSHLLNQYISNPICSSVCLQRPFVTIPPSNPPPNRPPNTLPINRQNHLNPPHSVLIHRKPTLPTNPALRDRRKRPPRPSNPISSRSHDLVLRNITIPNGQTTTDGLRGRQRPRRPRWCRTRRMGSRLGYATCSGFRPHCGTRGYFWICGS